ncbi:MAG: hypothetical protein WCT53_05455 [Candidatus Gracilibacteria bacterium]|jgi:hypothetical protein
MTNDEAGAVWIMGTDPDAPQKTGNWFNLALLAAGLALRRRGE